jgi:hypothetical protein
MISQDCIDSNLGERLRQSASSLGSSLSPELLHHAETCTNCRVAFVQTRRIARTWRELEPSSAEIAAARARIVRRSARSSRVRAFPGAAAFAVLLAGAAAFAGARAVTFHETSRGVLLSPAASPALAPPMRHATIAPLKPPQAPLALASPVPLALSAVLPPAPAPVRARAVSVPPVSEPPKSVPALEGWSDAARAMRAGDYAAAERAFDDLTHTDDACTRDEARLARAQVWIAQGRVAEATPELTRLAASGATARVRDKAATLLRSAQ